jgi:O-antigen ligase
MDAESEHPQPHTDANPGTRALPAALWALVLLAAILAPLLFSPWLHNAFELPKAVAVRALAGLSLLALLYQLGARQVRSWLAHPLAWPLLALAAALIAATLFAPHPGLSLWGAYERQFGLLTWLAPLALFAASLVALRSRARQERFVQVLVWSSAPIVAYGLLQALGGDPFAWDSDGASAVLATMGRSNFLGAYLVLTTPLTAAATLTAAKRWPLALLLAGQLIVLVLTRARAAWLGLLAAAIAFGLSWLVVSGRRRLAGRLVLLGLLLLAILASLLLLFGLPAALTEGGSTAARLTIWKATLPLIGQRPLLGYGPDGMQLAFQGVFPPELVYYQGRHLVVDRAHNLVLDITVNAGLLGLAAFMFLLWRAGRLMWRGLDSTADRDRLLLLAGIAAALVGHLVELQVSFETVATAAIFWLLLALGISLAGPSPAPAAHQAARHSWKPGPGLPLALAFAGLLAVLTVRPLLADHAYWRGQRQTPGSVAALGQFVEAKRQWPIEPVYQVALAQAYWASSQPAAAVSEAVSAAQLRPDDARLWAAAGDLLARWGATEPDHYAQALSAYRRAIDLSPNTAAYHTALGLILAESGRLAEGIAAVERAVELDATDAVAYGHLATLYEAAGQPEQAAWAAAQARRWSSETASPGP